MQEKKLKVAIYCRVGTEEQLETNTQESEIQKYCKQKGYEIFRSYKDNGYSANDKNRPGYNLMLEDLKKKRFDMIITSKIDRLNRSLNDFAEFASLVESYNCRLKSIYDDIDTSTATGKYFIRVLDIVNKYMKGSLTNEW